MPKHLWNEFLEKMLAIHKQIKMGSPEDFSSFMSAVIDEKAFDRISSYIEMAKNDKELKIETDASVGPDKRYIPMYLRGCVTVITT